MADKTLSKIKLFSAPTGDPNKRQCLLCGEYRTLGSIWDHLKRPHGITKQVMKRLEKMPRCPQCSKKNSGYFSSMEDLCLHLKTVCSKRPEAIKERYHTVTPPEAETQPKPLVVPIQEKREPRHILALNTVTHEFYFGELQDAERCLTRWASGAAKREELLAFDLSDARPMALVMSQAVTLEDAPELRDKYAAAHYVTNGGKKT